jgi:hypothetical protein
MTALAAGRAILSRDGKRFSDPVKEAAVIFRGALVVLDAAGDAMPGDTVANGAAVARGVAMEAADNTDGADGAISVPVMRGCFRFANSAAGDLITRAHIGDVCYVVDDQTVALTHNSNARIAAGTIRDVDAAGVWVEI